MTRRALVIGGSLGGLLAAYVLRTTGWDVTVFERNAEPLTSRGVGIGTHPQLIAVLKRVGINFDETMGVRVTKVICLDRDGHAVVERPTARTISSWARLYRAMHEALPSRYYRLGKALTRVDQGADRVTAWFSDGTSEQAELLIGADGFRSTVRAQFLPEAELCYAGYVGWRAVLDEGEVPRDIWRAIGELYTFCLPEGEQLMGFPMPGRDSDVRVGHRGYNILWYRPAETRRLADWSTDEIGRLHAAGIPPPLIRRDVIARMKADAYALMAPPIAEIFARTRPFFQAIYDLESPQIVFRRVVLIGDAAFLSRPHAGAGVTKAALDVASLADALRDASGDIDDGLSRYEQRQLPFGRQMVSLARRNGAYLSAQIKPPALRTAEERHRSIDDVLRTHGARSAEVQAIVNERGLDAHL